MSEKMRIYFIHSAKIDCNEEIYLPVLRSNYLSNHELIFPESNDNVKKYYKDLLDNSDLIVVNLTFADTGLLLLCKDALSSKKPILALARKDIGYDAKFQKMFDNVIGYLGEDDFRKYVEDFVRSYEGRIISGKLDSTIVLGDLN